MEFEAVVMPVPEGVGMAGIHVCDIQHKPAVLEVVIQREDIELDPPRRVVNPEFLIIYVVLTLE
jgi:hypothetical protein